MYLLLFYPLICLPPSNRTTTRVSGAFYIIISAPGHMGETTSSRVTILNYVTILFAIVDIVSPVAVVQWFILLELLLTTQTVPKLNTRPLPHIFILLDVIQIMYLFSN